MVTYKRIFDETNPYFKKNNWKFNRYFIETTISSLLGSLELGTVLILNDIYKILGFAVSSEGAVAGIVKDDLLGGNRLFQIKPISDSRYEISFTVRKSILEYLPKEESAE